MSSKKTLLKEAFGLDEEGKSITLSEEESGILYDILHRWQQEGADSDDPEGPKKERIIVGLMDKLT